MPEDGAERSEVLGSSVCRRGEGVGLVGCCSSAGVAYLACGLLALQCGEEDGPAIRSTRPNGTRTRLHAVGERYL